MKGITKSSRSNYSTLIVINVFLIILSHFIGGVRSYFFDELSINKYQHTSPPLFPTVTKRRVIPFSFTTTFSKTTSTILQLYGGGRGGQRGGYPNDYDDEYDEYDYDTSSRSRRPQSSHHHRRSHPPSRPSSATRRHYPQRRQPSAIDQTTKLAKQTLNLATSTTINTLKGTGRAAYYLTAPKYVERNEIFGIWRLDQVLFDDPDGEHSAANVEFTPKGDVVTQYNQEEEERTVYMFKRRSWPRSCSIEFEAKALQSSKDGRPVSYYYKGVFRRKMADRSIIKIEGKIYQVKRGRFWKGGGAGLEVGSFVGKKRMARRQVNYQEEDIYDEEYDDYDSPLDEDYDLNDNFDGEYDDGFYDDEEEEDGLYSDEEENYEEE